MKDRDASLDQLRGAAFVSLAQIERLIDMLKSELPDAGVLRLLLSVQERLGQLSDRAVVQGSTFRYVRQPYFVTSPAQLSDAEPMVYVRPDD